MINSLKDLIELISDEKSITINESDLHSIPEFLDFGGASMRPMFRISLFEKFCINYGYEYKVPNDSRFISIRLPKWK